MEKKLLSKAWRSLAALLLLGLLTASPIVAQTTAFTYQGKLTDSGNPANGNYDFQFKLFDALSGGTQQGATLSQASVAVSGGIFAVNLDFGANVFTGAARYLEISVKPAGSPGGYQQLLPRQPITSSPYAIQTVNAQQLGGLPATRYIATDPNGNVGIGTATPSTKLEVVHPISQLRFGPTTADNGGYLISTAPHQAIITGGAKYDGANWIAKDTAASLTAHHFGAIQFFTDSNLTVGSPYSPSARMTIEANGNVGIGTTSAAPGYKVDINSNGGGVRSFYNGSTHFVAETTGGTNAWAKYIMKTPNHQWAIGTSQNFNGDQLYISDETAGQIRMAIDTNGNVGIGTASPTAKLDVITGNNDSIAGSFQGIVYVTGTVAAAGYSTISDARLKQNITALGYGLAEVLRLRPVSWRWKAHPESGGQLGLVAQEVEPVLPELVSTVKNADKMKGLNYTGLIPVLVKAIQEQQAQIKEQSQQLKMQQTQIKQQQREIGALRRTVKAWKSGIHNP